MKKTGFLISFLLASIIMFAQPTKTFHDFTVETLDGKRFDLSSLKGKKVLVVNTASKCGLTPQYEDLQKLYQTYGGEKFTIIGFPANNFLKQEPGTNDEIREFCTENYGVTFPMMSKISVKGDDMHPVYKWLTQKSENGVMDSDVKWNFQKYLIDENGKLVDMVPPKEKPDSDKILNWIQGK
jgi:glutathione peroxidase